MNKQTTDEQIGSDEYMRARGFVEIPVDDAQPIKNPDGFGPTAAVMSKDIPIVTCVP